MKFEVTNEELDAIKYYLNEKYVVISVGRVMTCVLGMIVKREREIFIYCFNKFENFIF